MASGTRQTRNSRKSAESENDLAGFNTATQSPISVVESDENISNEENITHKKVQSISDEEIARMEMEVMRRRRYMELQAELRSLEVDILQISDDSPIHILESAPPPQNRECAPQQQQLPCIAQSSNNHECTQHPITTGNAQPPQIDECGQSQLCVNELPPPVLNDTNECMQSQNQYPVRECTQNLQFQLSDLPPPVFFECTQQRQIQLSELPPPAIREGTQQPRFQLSDVPPPISHGVSQSYIPFRNAQSVQNQQCTQSQSYTGYIPPPSNRECTIPEFPRHT